MKINFLGDSITEGAWAGVVEKRYTTLVANALCAEECNFGLSGTRIAKQVRKTNNPDDDVYTFFVKPATSVSSIHISTPTMA